MPTPGTLLTFNEAARACRVAKYLMEIGVGVVWDPVSPENVWTSLSRADAKKVERECKGVEDKWFTTERIDAYPKSSA